MFDLIEENGEVVLDRAKYYHDNGVTVKVAYNDGEWEPFGCQWPSSWVDTDLKGHGVGYGETLSEDELESRKGDALQATAELISEYNDE